MRIPVICATALGLLAASSLTLAAEDDAAGRQAYEANCARCHDSGIMGSPMTSNADEWEGRLPVTEASLQHHLDKGLLRNGVDDSARAAVAYMAKVLNPAE